MAGRIKSGGSKLHGLEPSADLCKAEFDSFVLGFKDSVGQLRDFPDVDRRPALVAANHQGIDDHRIECPCAFGPFRITEILEQCCEPTLYIWRIHNAPAQCARVLPTGAVELRHVEFGGLDLCIVLETVHQQLIL